MTNSNQGNNNNNNKRVRVDPTANTTPNLTRDPPPPATASPTKAATNALERSIESLPTELHPLLVHYGNLILSIRTKLAKKKKIEKRMDEEPTHLPRSCKATDFAVNLSQAAIDLDPDRAAFCQQQAE